jgi:hypothetical protein
MADCLSPAAQAVWDAAWADTPVICGDTEGTRKCQIAAAIKAAADVIDFDPWLKEHADYCAELRAIAAELEGL